MIPYQHTVQYYETDQMHIVHHSNYIRWMEEARVHYLAQIGWGLDRLEELGAVSPITALDVQYKRSALFPQVITIHVTLTKLTGVRLYLHYVMENPDGEVVFEGDSEHCFTDGAGRIFRLKKDLPGFYEALRARLPQAQDKP